jgi:tRNA1Val (adenine37-N6)-methyltransferase
VAGSLSPRPDETLDLLFGARVPLLQARDGHRTSVDALAVAWFAWRVAGAMGVLPHRVCDLGAGTGLVSLLLGRVWPRAQLHLVELQPQQVERAVRNLALSGLSARAIVECRDLADGLTIEGSAQLVVCNPPFRVPGREVVSANRERRLAHFESSASLEVFAARALQALAPQGVSCWVYPWHGVQRLTAALQAHARHVEVWPLYHRHGDAAPTRALVAVSQQPLPQAAPLALHEVGLPDSEYAREIQAFLSLL